jgi:hypothetical protein
MLLKCYFGEYEKLKEAKIECRILRHIRGIKNVDMTYEELIKKHPGSLVEKIVTEVVNKDAVEVHFEEEEVDQWAVIKVHVYEEDKEMAIRLLSDDRWVLQFGYYDDEDEFIELLQPLTQTEIDLIPKGLQKVMRKVLASEEGLRLPGNFLSR